MRRWRLNLFEIQSPELYGNIQKKLKPKNDWKGVRCNSHKYFDGHWQATSKAHCHGHKSLSRHGIQAWSCCVNVSVIKAEQKLDWNLPKVTDDYAAKVVKRREHLWAMNLNTINCSPFTKVQLPYQSFFFLSSRILIFLLIFFIFLSCPDKQLARLITAVDPLLEIWLMDKS